MGIKPKKAIQKKVFNIDDFKKSEGLDYCIKEKELSWIPLSEAFHDATKIPGIPIGYFSSFRGFSNTGKSTAIYEGVAGCQKIGILPVIFETEGNWNWEHARNIGVEFEEVIDETTGEVIDYKGDFIFLQSPDLLRKYQNYDHSSSKWGTKPLRHEAVVEDIALYMNYICDKQLDGTIPRDIAFFWDSVGSLNCYKGATSNNSNNQWTAGAMSSAFKSLIYQRIPASKREGVEFSLTLCVVQQIWLDNENKVVKHKGGEAFFSAPRLIVHFGGILTHSTEKLKATFQGSEYQFGVVTKVRVEKNQINGIEQKGVIASTPHGYWNPTKINEYKEIHREHIKSQLNTTYDDFIVEIERDFSKIYDNEA